MSVKIRGKIYLTVAERVGMLHAQYTRDVSITTAVIRATEHDAVIQATVTVGDQTFNGTAHEIRSDNPKDANFMSWVENCETSAIGRALASANFHGSEFASAEEIISALSHEKGSEVDIAKQFREAQSELKVAAETERELTKQLVALQAEVKAIKDQTALSIASDRVDELAIISDAEHRRAELMKLCEALVGQSTLDVVSQNFPPNLSGKDAKRLLMVCHLLSTAKAVIESE
jgi:hypothetical protein